MAYFPFMVDIEDKNCLVVGGGQIALHKIKKLLPFGVNIRVVAEEICPGLKSILEGNARLIADLKKYDDGELLGADLVIAATGIYETDLHIAKVCKEKNIPVNAVDIKEACSFIFPAMLQEKDLLIAVSTGGQSPSAAAYVKEKIAEGIPDYYGEMIEALGSLREQVISQVPDTRRRKEIFKQLLAYGDANKGKIPDEIVEEIINSG